MAKFIVAPLMLACLPLLAQEAGIRDKFVGTWEAKWKDTVICTIRLKPGEPLSGETEACDIQVDANGDLQAPQSNEKVDQPAPILNPKLNGQTLAFEEQDGDEVIAFQLKLLSDGKAELTIPNAPVRINPIRFTRR